MALALDTLAAVAPEPGPRVTEAAEAVAEVLKRLSRGPMRRHAVYACVAATAVARLRVSSPEVGRVLAVAATAAMRRGQLPLDAAAAAVSALRPPGACTAGARYALLACGTATVLPKGWMVPEEQHHFPVICSGPLACQLLLSFAGLRAERSAWFLGDILVTNGRRMLAGVAREAVRHGSKPETEGELVCKVVWATVTLRMARAACRLSEPYAARVAAMAAAGEFPLAAGLAASSLSAARRCRLRSGEEEGEEEAAAAKDAIAAVQSSATAGASPIPLARVCPRTLAALTAAVVSTSVAEPFFLAAAASRTAIFPSHHWGESSEAARLLLWAFARGHAKLPAEVGARLLAPLARRAAGGLLPIRSALAALWACSILGLRPSSLAPEVAKWVPDMDGLSRAEDAQLAVTLAEEARLARRFKGYAAALPMAPAIAALVARAGIGGRVEAGDWCRAAASCAHAFRPPGAATESPGGGDAAEDAAAAVPTPQAAAARVAISVCELAGRHLHMAPSVERAVRLLHSWAVLHWRPSGRRIQQMCALLARGGVTDHTVAARAWWSLAALRISDLPVLRHLACSLEDAAPSLGTWDVAGALWALSVQLDLAHERTGTDAPPPPSLVAALARRSCEVAGRMTAGDYEHALAALQRFDSKHAAALRAARSAAAPRQGAERREAERGARKVGHSATPLDALAAEWSREPPPRPRPVPAPNRRHRGALEEWQPTDSQAQRLPPWQPVRAADEAIFEGRPAQRADKWEWC